MMKKTPKELLSRKTKMLVSDIIRSGNGLYERQIPKERTSNRSERLKEKATALMEYFIGLAQVYAFRFAYMNTTCGKPIPSDEIHLIQKGVVLKEDVLELPGNI